MIVNELPRLVIRMTRAAPDSMEESCQLIYVLAGVKIVNISVLFKYPSVA